MEGDESVAVWGDEEEVVLAEEDVGPDPPCGEWWADRGEVDAAGGVGFLAMAEVDSASLPSA